MSLKRPWQKLTVFRAAANRSAAFQSGCLGCAGPSRICGEGKRDSVAQARAGALRQARFDQAKARQYPQTVARKSAIRLRPRNVWGPRRPAAELPLATRRRSRRLSGRTAMRDITRRTSWPRASGPSSRITGAEPACTVSGCGCVPAPGARLFPVGAVRVAAHYLPDRYVRSFRGASRTQPHEAVNRVCRDGEARGSHGAARLDPPPSPNRRCRRGAARRAGHR